MSAWRCDSAASGGLILKRAASSESTSSSVSSRWCGEASAETSTPQAARAPHLLDRLLDVQVADVQRPALVARDAEVAGDHRRLGDRRVADQPEPGADRALVHVGRARERRVLAVQREHPPGRRGVLQRAPQQRGREHRAAVVGVAAGAVVGELAERRELLAELPHRDRGQEPDAHARVERGPLVQRVEHLRGVDHRVGVGHREHAAVAAGGGRRGAGREILLVLLAGRAQVHVRIDEGGQQRAAVGLDHLDAGRARRARRRAPRSRRRARARRGARRCPRRDRARGRRARARRRAAPAAWISRPGSRPLTPPPLRRRARRRARPCAPRGRRAPARSRARRPSRRPRR